MFIIHADGNGGPGPILDFEFLPFFDLDSLPGVVELERTLDASSDEILIPDGIIIGDKIITRAFVSILYYLLCIHAYICL